MEDADKTALALSLCGIADAQGADAALVASSYMPLAKDAIMRARHPFSSDPSGEEWEARYDVLQCEIAADLFNRRGAEGEVSHSENGVNRTWASAGVSKHLIARVVPRGKVPA